VRRFIFQIRGLVAVGAALVLGASALFAVVSYQEYRELVWYNLQRPAWRLMQTEVELEKFNNALDLHFLSPSEQTRQNLELRYDILWNRIDVTFNGLEAPRILAVQDVAGSLNDLRSAVKRVEPQLESLKSGDRVLLGAVRTEFLMLSGRLHESVLQVYNNPVYNGLAANRAETVFTRSTMIFFVAALVVLAVFLILFVGESRRSKRLLRQSQDALELAEARRAEAAAAHARTAAALAEAEEASLAKSNFLANMSHELRTPLNAILGFSEMMTQGIFGKLQPPRYVEYVTHIYDSAKHLLSLVDDLLTLGRIEAGGYSPTAATVDIVAVARFAGDLVGVRAMASNVDLRMLLPERPVLISGDERALRQIALNLATNAVKFTPSGGHVDIRVDFRPNGEICFSVADTGIGIPQEAHTQVFEPFFQVDNVFARRNQGAGLGLALVRSLAVAHGARVELDSAPGRGTTVSVIFPPVTDQF
jgi:signal transduction histidine kinase